MHFLMWCVYVSSVYYIVIMQFDVSKCTYMCWQIVFYKESDCFCAVARLVEQQQQSGGSLQLSRVCHQHLWLNSNHEHKSHIWYHFNISVWSISWCIDRIENHNVYMCNGIAQEPYFRITRNREWYSVLSTDRKKTKSVFSVCAMYTSLYRWHRIPRQYAAMNCNEWISCYYCYVRIICCKNGSFIPRSCFFLSVYERVFAI